MRGAFKDLFAVDRLIHEPARLAIVTILEACRSADFVFLASATGLPNGNLSAHLSKLRAAGLIVIDKSFRGKWPHTDVSLTPRGRENVRRYWRCLNEAQKTADAWRTLAQPPAVTV
jgi:DNA-binding transcriptional ArsR family regulator